MPNSPNDLPAAIVNGLSPLEEARLILATAQARASSGDLEPDSVTRILAEAVDDSLALLRRVKS